MVKPAANDDEKDVKMMKKSKSLIAQGLEETRQKVEISLLPAIQEHIASTEFSPTQGLDFLRVMNSLLLSYLIELTNYTRNQIVAKKKTKSEACLDRLLVMKTVLDKSKSLEKKLSYQIDKLLASGSTATSFVAAGSQDPLQLRPDIDDKDDDDDEGENDHDEDSDASDVDPDLEAAQLTVAARRKKKSEEKKRNEHESDGDDDGNDNEDDGVYRAPRLSAVPYNLDQEDREAERNERQRRRMRASELAQALREQVGEGPEEDDIYGGTDLGRQRQAAKLFAQQQEEKTRYEEGAMVRLATTRKEKQGMKKILRQEYSNLAAIADLGNIVRDAAWGERENKSPKSSPRDGARPQGQRKRAWIDPTNGRFSSTENRPQQKPISAKNALQATLFGTTAKSKKSKKSRRK